MAGIYIHIPFCKRRCIYCGFFSCTDLGFRQRYTDAVCREIGTRVSDLNADEIISTVYFGGGTPSCLSIRQLEQIVKALDNAFPNRLKLEEFTIECNPDDVDENLVKELWMLGANRISLGIQTFNDQRLRFINRRHTSAKARQAIDDIRKAGVENISIDLMFGFPGETAEEWSKDLDEAVRLSPAHISSYSLSYEEGTPLRKMLESGMVAETDEETSRRMYYLMKDRLEQAGYEHYEISNFAKKGDTRRRALHNSTYWSLKPYLGIGAAAHSFCTNTRRWNAADIKSYIEGIELGTPAYQYETLDNTMKYNDTVMLRLRTCEGLCLSQLSTGHREYCEKTSQSYIRNGLLRKDGDWLRLSREGLFVSDMIMSELMIV